MRNNRTARRVAATLGTLALAAGVSTALAGPAAAADRTSGHFDVAAEITCDVSGNVVGVEVGLHEHVNGNHVELPAGDWLAYTSNSGPAVGFAVEADGCDPVSVQFKPKRLISTSTGGTIAGVSSGGWLVSSKTSASGSVTLTSAGHEDVSWGFSSNGTYLLPFDVTVAGYGTVTSAAVPFKKS
ncbi:hypothetical protein [Antribacter gilvus]|uniref:hypothetical protein n=1 Tax=Antribacter gilvus TaxID=2304675 RepID=UPI000F766600|nr:hypothetical protein [Antribacter gilvus]